MIQPPSPNGRVATQEELNDLPDDRPSITAPRRIEDMWDVDVAMNIVQCGPNERDFSANLDRWYFRLN